MTEYEKQFKDLAQKLVGSILKNKYQIVHKYECKYDFGSYISSNKYFIYDGKKEVCELNFYDYTHSTEKIDLQTLKTAVDKIDKYLIDKKKFGRDFLMKWLDEEIERQSSESSKEVNE